MKKVAMSPAERQQSSRAARVAAGGTYVSGVLTKEAGQKLKAIMARDGTGRIQTISRVLERTRPA